jgi:hypothetical protein
MQSNRRVSVRAAGRPAVFLAALVLLSLAAAAPLLADRVRNHFDSDSIMRPPGFFDFVVLGAPSEAKWLVLSDRNPPSAPSCAVQVESSRPDASVAVAVRRTYSYEDGVASEFIKMGGSRLGIVLRFVDDKNYLLLLVDGKTGEGVLTSVRDGKSDVIGRGKVATTETWPKLTIEASGPAIKARLGDAALLEGKDPHPAAGRVGMAAAGAGEARFDELILDSPEIKSQ